MAPGANIQFVGAQDCFDSSLLAALQTAVTSGASVVSDSWGDALGDLLDDADTKTAFDNIFMMAGATGVSVLFSSGDDGDNFADFGLNVPDYPARSPFVTAVGGTSLEVSKGAQSAEYGWSTGKQTMCAAWRRPTAARRRHPPAPSPVRLVVAVGPATPTSSPTTRRGSSRTLSRPGTRRCSARSRSG